MAVAVVSRVLTVNVGSSSLKLDLLGDSDELVTRCELADWDGDVEPVRELLARERADLIGHRVVHGGWSLSGPTLLDDDVADAIAAAIPLAPLHQRRALTGIEAARRVAPGIPAVACFDTTFHNTTPTEAAVYAVPREWRESYGIIRFGFHGLSHAYVGRRAAELVGRGADEIRTVSCHLGSGASLCAIDRGRSVDTTMGLTPLDGLVMGTRSGSIDPGILLWLLSEKHLSVEELSDGLEHRGGLLALTGTSDMAAAVASDDPAVREGLSVYVHRLVGGIAAMAAAMGGLDVLAFTGGVGENSGWLRAEVADRLGFLGVGVDPDINERSDPDAELSSRTANVRTVVVAAREDLEIARWTRAVADTGG